MGSAPGTSVAERMAAALVLALLTIGSVALWVAIPIGCLWLSAQVADNLAQHFILALPMTIAAMSVWVLLLAWLNQLYLRASGVLARIEADERAGWRRRRVRGPLEPILIACFFVAIVALFVWFFFFAHGLSQQVI